MVSEIPPEKMAAYREYARRQREQRAEAVAERRERAWRLAHEATRLLKSEFGATRVAVFGSLVHPKRFHSRSDVDLAVWGIDERVYLRALARLLDLQPDISVDLIEAEFASPAIKAIIEQEGVTL